MRRDRDVCLAAHGDGCYSTGMPPSHVTGNDNHGVYRALRLESLWQVHPVASTKAVDAGRLPRLSCQEAIASEHPGLAASRFVLRSRPLVPKQISEPTQDGAFSLT